MNGFYWYLSKTKSDSEKGIVSSTYYSGSAYPSTTTTSLTGASDIIQFYKDGDWEHSAIVTYKTSSNDVYVCMHDYENYYQQCSLSTFYANAYPTSGTRYIRFVKISGYYN